MLCQVGITLILPDFELTFLLDPELKARIQAFLIERRKKPTALDLPEEEVVKMDVSEAAAHKMDMSE